MNFRRILVHRKPLFLRQCRVLSGIAAKGGLKTAGGRYSTGLILLALVLLAPGASYSDSLTKPPVKQVSLTLKECIALTLKNNIRIRIEGITPLIAGTAITKGESEFEPAFTASVSTGKGRTPSASTFADPKVGEAETFSISAGVKKRYKTGTELKIDAISDRQLTNSRFQGINPEYNTSLKISASQDLLKGFGTDINTAAIRIAAINMESSRLSFRNTVFDLLASVQLTYLDLVFARKDLEVKRENLRLAMEFENRVKTQVEIGVLPPIEITQAKAEAALREEEIIIAESNIQNLEDQLKQFINISSDFSSYRLLPSEVPMLEREPGTLEEDIAAALEKRPDYLQALSDLASLKIDRLKKENLLLPSLNLNGALELDGLSGSAKTLTGLDGVTAKSDFGGSYGKSLENIFQGKYYKWNFGVLLTIPIGNRAAKSDLLAVNLNTKKKSGIIENLTQTIITQIRAARRRIETARKRIEVTKVSGKFAKEKLEAEETKYKLGMSTSFNVLEFQRDLSEARTRELLAVSDYNKAVINLELVTGRLLEKNNIDLN